MNETLRMWVEISFNILYLIVIYFLVIRMSTALKKGLLHSDLPNLKLFRNGFLLLALGDTGHVGFRVIAYAMGGLEHSINLGGFTLPLVGAGAAATAYTVTVFYMVILDVWRRRFQSPKGFFYVLLMVVGLARMVLMAFPANQWNQVVPPYFWSLLRNGLLTFLGVSTAVLMLKEGRRHGDHVFNKMAVCILVSYAFYLPVILFVHQIPLIGMLMIPKTIAYIAMAGIGYRGLFPFTR